MMDRQLLGNIQRFWDKSVNISKKVESCLGLWQNEAKFRTFEIFIDVSSNHKLDCNQNCWAVI